jgi:hypothetical protein
VSEQRQDEVTDDVHFILVFVDLETTDEAEGPEPCLVEREYVVNRERVNRLTSQSIECRSSSIKGLEAGKLVIDGSPEGIKGFEDGLEGVALSLQLRNEFPRTVLAEGLFIDGWESGQPRDGKRSLPSQDCTSLRRTNTN